jgi:hypothetical protein
MSEAVPMDLVIADLQISEISDAELENALHRVVVGHKNAIASIHDSMEDADYVYRKYLDPNYVPQEDIAKKDRAELNKAEKIIAERYAELKEAYEKPLQNIEANIKSIRNAIKEASGVVDKAVKTYDELRKKKKQQEVTDYFITKKFDLVPLERIWDEKWLNKTANMKDIAEQMDAAITKIYADIQVLEQIPEHGMTAKAMYLKTLDMGAALREVNALKENAERLAREEANRAERQMQEQCDRNASAECKEEREKAKEEIIKGKIDEAVGLPVGTTAAQERLEVMEYTLQFRGTKDQLMKLREYMTSQGIPYQKLLMFHNEKDAANYKRNQRIQGDILTAVILRIESVA